MDKVRYCVELFEENGSLILSGKASAETSEEAADILPERHRGDLIGIDTVEVRMK